MTEYRNFGWQKIRFLPIIKRLKFLPTKSKWILNLMLPLEYVQINLLPVLVVFIDAQSRFAFVISEPHEVSLGMVL